MSEGLDPAEFEVADHGEGTPVGALDDFAPATRRDVNLLIRRVRELRNEIASAQRKADAALPREDADAFRKENARIRKRVVFTILTAVVISLLLTTVGNDAVLKHCFLDSSGGELHHSMFCNTLFPGYDRTVDENNVRLQQFNGLIKQIPQNHREIARLQHEIALLRGHR